MIIDSRIGGMGDVWMRLCALYTLSRMTGQRHTILINPALASMAKKLFGERIDIGEKGEGDMIYTHLGLRHVLPGIITGKRYVFPFHWAMHSVRPKTTLKHRLNDGLILGAERLGFIRLTNRARPADYAGYMEIAALPPFAGISFEDFSRAAHSDLPELQIRFKEIGSKFTPRNESTIVYPSGNAHQIMPVNWAQQHLSDAVFVFHRDDSQALGFEKSGLHVEQFASLDELLQSGFGARRIICTDSFPSHFWQVYMTGVLLLQTIQMSSYVVHPGFPRSQVIVSRAPCCPCLHITRGLQNAPCAKGYSTCLTWNDPDYAAALSQASIGLI